MTEYEEVVALLNKLGVHTAERGLGFIELFVAPAAERPAFVFNRKTGQFYGVRDTAGGDRILFASQTQERMATGARWGDEKESKPAKNPQLW